mgnify:CR=1 FL=1
MKLTPAGLAGSFLIDLQRNGKTGAAVGAAASQHSRESRTYHLLVRFQDGSFGMFVFSGAPPFQPGQPVALTPQGLLPL